MPKPLSSSLKQKKQEDNKQLKTSKEPLKGGRIPPKALHITALSHSMFDDQSVYLIASSPQRN